MFCRSIASELPKLQHVWAIGALGMGVLSLGLNKGQKGGKKDGGKLWSSVWVSTRAIDLVGGLRFTKSMQVNDQGWLRC